MDHTTCRDGGGRETEGGGGRSEGGVVVDASW